MNRILYCLDITLGFRFGDLFLVIDFSNFKFLVCFDSSFNLARYGFDFEEKKKVFVAEKSTAMDKKEERS